MSGTSWRITKRLIFVKILGSHHVNFVFHLRFRCDGEFAASPRKGLRKHDASVQLLGTTGFLYYFLARFVLEDPQNAKLLRGLALLLAQLKIQWRYLL